MKNKTYSIAPEKLQDILESGGKLPPQAISMEEAVLGSVLAEPERLQEISGRITAADFYKPAHKYIYETFLRLDNKGEPIDLLTVEDDLEDRGLRQKVGGSGTLAYLTSAVSSAANAEYYAEIVREKSVMRKLILDSSEIISKAYEQDVNLYDLLEYNEQKTFELSNVTAVKEEGVDFVTNLGQTLDEIAERKKNPDKLDGVTSGIDALDDRIGCFENGNLYIIAARPSMGKTGFMLSCAKNLANHPNSFSRGGSAIFSLEMSVPQLVKRFLAMDSKVSLTNIMRSKVDQGEFERLIEVADDRMKNYNIILDDTAVTFREMKSRTRKYIQKYGIKAVYVDYLQLMNGSGGEDNREKEIAGISRGLKQMAKEFNIPVVALSQLSRAVEARGGFKIPQLSDLRESGQIEQDADVVGFIWRPEYYQIQTYDDQSTANIGYLIIAKQRNGPVGKVRLQFNKESTEFRDLAFTGGTSPF